MLNTICSGAINLEAIMAERHSADLAERVRFEVNAAASFASFDQRSDDELLRVASNHDSAMERERALWEYAYRHGSDALASIDKYLHTEPEPSVRWNLLWLSVKLGGDAALPLIKRALHDENCEVRDWARLFLEELTSEPYGMEYSSAVYESTGTFDQTLPLQIAGHANVLVPNVGWVRARLSPLWFAHIMGRVMACTNVETFMTDLIIEKELKGYNPDGSNHYEIFLFRGASHLITDTIAQHIYESNTMRPFYQSGKVKEGIPYSSPVCLTRIAFTDRVQIAIGERSGASDLRGQRLAEFGVVRSVRGHFSGWAYTDLSRYLATGEVQPGTVQLVSTADPIVGKRANTVLYGTFRGKLGDLDGDGQFDVNSIPCHGTVDGLIDLDCDGIADADPFVPRG
jgi:hypothetical protein